MLTVRLNVDLQNELNELCERMNRSKSEVVKEAIKDYLQKERANPSPYELGKDLFGIEGSETKDASVTYKERLKKKYGEKYSH